MDVLKQKCSQAIRKINSLVLAVAAQHWDALFSNGAVGKFDPAQPSPHSSDRNF